MLLLYLSPPPPIPSPSRAPFDPLTPHLPVTVRGHAVRPAARVQERPFALREVLPLAVQQLTVRGATWATGAIGFLGPRPVRTLAAVRGRDPTRPTVGDHLGDLGAVGAAGGGGVEAGRIAVEVEFLCGKGGGEREW